MRGALEGITRKTTIELATALGYKAETRSVSADEARTADEVFITSTVGGIMPVTRVDGQAVGTGTPGPITLELSAGYWKLHDDPRYALAINYV